MRPRAIPNFYSVSRNREKPLYCTGRVALSPEFPGSINPFIIHLLRCSDVHWKFTETFFTIFYTIIAMLLILHLRQSELSIKRLHAGIYLALAY